MIITLILSALLIYLLFGINSPKENRNTINNMSIIHELQQIDTAWSLTTLQTLSVENSDFDQVAAFLPQFRRLRNQLSNSEIADKQTPAPLQNKLLVFLNLLEGKEQAIEEFKSNLAVTRNSKKYLPLAAKTLSIKAKEINNDALVILLQDLNQEVSDYLQYPNETHKNKILKKLYQLNQKLMEFPANIVNPLGNFISHAKVLIERKIPMDKIVARVIDDQAINVGTELLLLYQGYKDNIQKNINQNKQTITQSQQITTLALVIIALITGFYSFNSATRYHNQLKKTVQQRTDKLKQQVDRATNSVVDNHHGNNMNTMDAMVATLAHEINTPLGYMSSNLEVLQTGTEKLNLLKEELNSLNSILELSDETQLRSRMTSLMNASTNICEESMLDEFPEIMIDISTGIEQIQHIIQKLRDFSRQDRLETEWYNLNHCIDDALKMAKHQLGDNIKINTKLNDLPQIYGSQADMNQVLINLINNASLAIKEANRPQGIIQLTTQIIQKNIVIDIQDNGNGMSPELTKKIFEPFFTTRDVGKGTGLGLAVVKKIISQNHGKILVKSIATKGTLFRIAIPVPIENN
jgi:signal transduction histidine kinase